MESSIPFVVVLGFLMDLFLVFVWGRVGANASLAAELNPVFKVLLGRLRGRSSISFFLNTWFEEEGEAELTPYSY